VRLQILAIGRLKSGPERELVERYRVRADALARSLGFGLVNITELPEAKARSAPERVAAEAVSLLARSEGAKLIVLDERAPSLTSNALADRLRSWREAGAGSSFIIGGPDGLDESVRRRADLLLSFGQLTLPHQMVRVLLAEQIYRALTIMAGHPYHRGEPGGD
jgi:23S rRNA (pseudouridine1915-N3)-methyltransferase